MKDLVTKNRTVSYEPIDNFYHYSAISIRSLVQKKSDSEAFTILYTIGIFSFAKEHNDLGVSTILMPLAIYSHLGLGSPKIILIRLFMADSLHKQLVSILYDVLAKVANFTFLEDFVIL